MNRLIFELFLHSLFFNSMNNQGNNNNPNTGRNREEEEKKKREQGQGQGQQGQSGMAGSYGGSTGGSDRDYGTSSDQQKR